MAEGNATGGTGRFRLGYATETQRQSAAEFVAYLLAAGLELEGEVTADTFLDIRVVDPEEQR